MFRPADKNNNALQRAEAEIERLKAENARLAELLAMAQEFGRLGMWERNPRTLEGKWDDHMFRFFGFEPGPTPRFEEVAERIHPDDRIDDNFKASLHAPGSHSRRYRIARPDGSVAHMHSQWRVVTDAAGQAERVLGVVVDDTESHLLAQRMADASEQLELALSITGIGLWRYDFETRRIHYDAHGQSILDRSMGPEGVPIETVHSWIHPDDLADVQAAFARVLEQKEPVDTQTRYLHRNGSWRTVLTRRVLRRDARGQPLAIIGVGLDITEQQQRTTDALALARRLETAADAARVGLWSGTIDGRPPQWNSHMYVLLGRDPLAAALGVGDVLRQHAHAEDRDRVAARVLEWLRSERDSSLDLELRMIRSDGAVRWMEVRSRKETDAEGTPRAFGVMLDVTEQREAMQWLREANERVSLALSAVNMGTWHDDVQSGVEHWDEQMFRLRGLEPASGAPDAGARMAMVLPEDRAHLATASIPLLTSKEPLAYDFRVVRANDGAVRTIASRSIALVDSAGHVTRRIGVNWDVTDARSVERAQREREVALRESRTKSALFARVSHELRTPLNAVLGLTQLLLTGDAQADAAQRRERLLHVQAAGERLLAIVDDVLELGLQVESESTAASIGMPASAAAIDAPRVLYIEDNDVNMLIVRELLSQRPHLQFHGAADGLSGVRRARDLKPALLLIDMQLPDIDGLEVMRRLRADPATQAIPCVALSANAMPEDVRRARAAGFDDYWTKPIDLSAFLREIDRLLPATRP